MKILVTGGLGFIGSNIAERLVRDGHEVSILDNLHTGSEENIASIRPKVKLVRGNAGELERIGASGGEIKFDLIFHDGVYSSTPMYKTNPLYTSMVIDDWIKVLEYCRKNSCKVVYASTSSLYNGQKPPHREDLPIAVTDFYSEARVAMERLALLYDRLYSIRSVGLRYFSVYGPHERSKKQYANLISQFLWDLHEGKQPVIYGDGLQTRDFTHVDDVVEANMLAMKYVNSKTNIFNVGTGKSITINDMLVILNKKLGTNLSAKYIVNPIKNYVEHTLADTTRASKELGFTAKVSLDAGIESLVSYYKTNPKA